MLFPYYLTGNFLDPEADLIFLLSLFCYTLYKGVSTSDIFS